MIDLVFFKMCLICVYGVMVDVVDDYVVCLWESVDWDEVLLLDCIMSELIVDIICWIVFFILFDMGILCDVFDDFVVFEWGVV